MRETEFLVEHQLASVLFFCDRAGFVINEFSQGKKVAAINRSGAPRERQPWMDGVDYIAGSKFSHRMYLSMSFSDALEFGQS
jgi:hypothetical protein